MDVTILAFLTQQNLVENLLTVSYLEQDKLEIR